MVPSSALPSTHPRPTGTRWSLVQRAQGQTPAARAALAELCAIYYQPVLGFMRQQSRDPELARDLTQAFFAQVLELATLGGADPQRGRFRSYLYGAARHFIAEHWRTERTLKRGGAAQRVDGTDAEVLAQLPCPELPPDAAFDRAWACTVLDRTLQLLQAEMAAVGKAETYHQLKPWLAGQADHGDTRTAALALHTSETAVRVHLSRLRKRMRELLHAELAQTLTQATDVDAELRHLMAALRG